MGGHYGEKTTDDSDNDSSGHKESSTGELVQSFWENSSLQGLPQVFIAPSRFWKMFWLLMCIILLLGCAYQMWSIFLKFYARETTTSVTIGYGEVEFPSVTVCNINRVKENELLKIVPQRVAQAYRKNKHGVQANCSEMEDMDECSNIETYIDNLSLDQWDQIMHTGSTGIVYSAFTKAHGESGGYIGSLNYSTSYNSAHGKCFTFNSAKIQNEPIIAKKPGKREGLWLYLYAEDHEYLHGYSLSRGFMVDIHAFNTTDHVEDVGIGIPAGQHTIINLRQSKVNRLDPPYGDCSHEYMRSYEAVYDFKYSVQACNHTCEHYYIAEDCGCYEQIHAKYYTPHMLDTLTRCNARENATQAACIESVHDAVYETRTKKCACPLPCHETSYDIDESVTPLSSRDVWHFFTSSICEHDPNATAPDSHCMRVKNVPEENRDEFTRRNFAVVSVSFRELVFDTYNEQISYGRSEFISDFGGNLGLWLGASIVTVLEVVELFTKIGVHAAVRRNRKRRRRKRKRKQAEQNGNQDNDIPLKTAAAVAEGGDEIPA